MRHRKEHWVRQSLRYLVTGAPMLAFVGFIATSLDATWNSEMGWAAFWLCLGWVVAVIGTYLAEPLIDAKAKKRWAATILIAVLTTVAIIPIHMYELHYRRQKQPAPAAPLTKEDITQAVQRPARLSVQKIQGVKVSADAAQMFNIYLLNAGDHYAKWLQYAGAFFKTQEAIDAGSENKAFAIILKQPMLPISKYASEIEPGKSIWFTVGGVANGTNTDRAKYDEMFRGQGILYAMLVLRYQDTMTSKEWVTEYCVYRVGEVVHFCISHNRVYEVSKGAIPLPQ